MPDSKASYSATPRPLRVFLCHSSADKPAVRDLYRRLCADGFEVWFDEESLVPGQTWRVEIPKAVRNSDVVIVCLSPAAVGRAGYVQKEITFALDVAEEQPEDAIYLIPLKLQECKVPARLSGWQWVNYFDPAGYERLMRALQVRAKSLGTNTVPVSEPALRSTTEQIMPQVSDRSGGVNAKATEMNVGADVVGRDKIESAGRDIIHVASGATVILGERSSAKSTATTAFSRHLRELFTRRWIRWGLIFLGVLAGIYLVSKALIPSESVGTSATPTAMAMQAASTITSTVKPTTASGSPTGTTSPTSVAQQTPALRISPEPTSLPSLTTTPITMPQGTSSSLPLPLSTKNIDVITLRTGKTISVAADWLEYIDGGSQRTISVGFASKGQGVILFSDLKSTEVYTSITTYSDVTITVQLLNGTKLTDTVHAGGQLKGITSDGAFAIPIAEVQHIDFGLKTDTPMVVYLTTVVNSAGEEIQIPTDLIEATFRGSSMAGPYTYVRDGLSMYPGIVMPFELLRSLKLDPITSTSDYTLTVSLLDGSTVARMLDTVDSPSIRGLTSLGAFSLAIRDVRQINFHRQSDALVKLPSVATITLRDGREYVVPTAWLAYGRYDWAAALPTTNHGNLYFRLMKSLDLEVGSASYDITATVKLLQDQIVVDKVDRYGASELFALTREGQLIDVHIADVKRIDLSTAPVQLPTVALGTITIQPGYSTHAGFELKTPVNSVKMHFGYTGMAGYSVDNTSDLPLSLGTSIPFSKIRKVVFGGYDSNQGIKLTLSLLDGQTLVTHLKSTALDTSLCGLSDIGPFNLTISDNPIVDFNR